MATTHDQWLTIGKILSVLGALTIFGPWLTIDYYDHYGAIYESYNGLSLFDSGYYFGIAMLVPIVVALIFVFMFIRFKVYGNEKCLPYIGVAFIVIFLLSWFYNVSANWTYDNYPYYTEVYGSGLAETGAVIIGIANIIIAHLADKNSNNNPSYESNGQVMNNSTLTNTINFCPKCGEKITTQSGEIPSYCPKCGSYIDKKMILSIQKK